MNEFEELTKYINILESSSYGEWFEDHENDGSMERPIQFSFVNYSSQVGRFMDDFGCFCEKHPKYGYQEYGKILEQHSIGWAIDSMTEADVSRADARLIIALITGAIRAERFCDGALLEFLSNGSLIRWLKRLKEIDDARESAVDMPD